MRCRNGPADQALPRVEEVPIPAILHLLPPLHEDRPRGSKAMIDVQAATNAIMRAFG